ncbi:DUF1552 domain-containing protein [Lignipirellula cremea]|uniref:Uncharacterized protein n=1 Tax=Lignipirellula cremea TaxID=2528010 RepID=A0A518DKR9_9BACT|nr:DUF1552 domain-containing protein [Lignipirellula cremea]QDU92434.1 hypothetical protein Pla8534_01820 [Lignipirellula cremea]
MKAGAFNEPFQSYVGEYANHPEDIPKLFLDSIEVDQMVAVIKKGLDQYDMSYTEAMRFGLQTVLCASKFLDIAEPGAQAEGPRPLHDYELASRLSCFLWSTMPDEELEEYFTSIRDLENRMAIDREWMHKPKPNVEPPSFGDEQGLDPEQAGLDYRRYQRLMFDVLALALQTDSTRVISYMARKDSSDGTGAYRQETNNPYGYHTMTHHGEDEDKLKWWSIGVKHQGYIFKEDDYLGNMRQTMFNVMGVPVPQDFQGGEADGLISEVL